MYNTAGIAANKSGLAFVITCKNTLRNSYSQKCALLEPAVKKRSRIFRNNYFKFEIKMQIIG